MKRLSLFLALLLVFAAAPSVARADLVDPDRPARVPVRPYRRTTNAIVSLVPQEDGTARLLLRFVLPGTGTLDFALHDLEQDVQVLGDSVSFPEDERHEFLAEFLCPALPEGAAAHYRLESTFLRTEYVETRYGRKRQYHSEPMNHNLTVENRAGSLVLTETDDPQ